MDEETTGQAAPEAPPGGDTTGAVAEAPPPVEGTAETGSAAPPESEPGHPGFEAWLAADAERINAEAAAAESGETPPPDPTVTATTEQTAAAPASTEAPKPAETPPAFDEAAILQQLQERGYKVEAPAPPPDPYATLTARLAPHVGTPEEYTAARATALAPISDTDPDWTEKTAARDAAAARVQAFDAARSITDLSRSWSRQVALGELGSALSNLPAQYGLPADKAQRVVQPSTMTDAVAAVAEHVKASTDAEWQTKYDAREKYWQGEVARAKSDRTVEGVRSLGRAPQATSVPGGRQAQPETFYKTRPGTDLPTEEEIQRMIRGDYAHVDLSNR